MNKREYTQANKDWLEAKSKEEGVKASSLNPASPAAQQLSSR